MDNEEFDVAVVGAGVMGSCTALSLAQAGLTTALIDQFPLPHTRGSSGGQSRLGGMANYSSPVMKNIVLHGYKQWFRLMAQGTENGFKLAPLLTIGQDSEAMKQEADMIRANGYEPLWIPIETLNQKYKTSFPPESEAILDPSGGVFFAHKCVQMVQRLFTKWGGILLDAWPVRKIEPGEPWTKLTGPRTTIRAKSVVLCPGPWANQVLLPLGVHLPLRSVKTGVFYWKVKNEDLPRHIVTDMRDPHNSFYAVSPLEYPGLVKLSIHDGVDATPDCRDKADLSQLKVKVSKYVEKYFPNLETEPAIEESCMDTVTPDGLFIMDRHPVHSNIIFAVGFSGCGFKVGPAVGEMLAAMVQGHPPIHDLTPFCAQRFTKSASATTLSPASKF